MLFLYSRIKNVKQMQDLTDVKIFLASIFQPLIIDAVNGCFANQASVGTLNSTPDIDELLTPEETAQLLKVSKVTIWQWSKPTPGILNPRRIGNQVRYLRSEVMAAARPTKGNKAA